MRSCFVRASPAAIVSGLATMAVLAGCAPDSQPSSPAPDPFELRRIDDALVADASRVVEANNRFAFDLYETLRTGDENLFLSPFSIATALEMTLAGARGVTEQEIAGVLTLDLPQEWIHPAAGALVQSLDRGIAIGGYRLSVANRLWGQSGYDFVRSFVATTRDHYAAEMAALDFAGSPEPSRQVINDWIQTKTEDRIVDLLPPGMINPATKLVLTNAIYFKGDWAHKFDRADTKDAPFHVSSGVDALVPMMTQTSQFRAAFLDKISILELPYVGEDLAMLVLLPNDQEGLGALEEDLSAANLESWVSRLAPSKRVVTLPRFKIESTFSLNETLAAMGMPSAFDGSSDFSGIDGRRDLAITEVRHKAFVEVNEEGTEAAAATVVGVEPPGLSMFIADHPFVFLIRDNVTGSVLFLGRVVDPR